MVKTIPRTLQQNGIAECMNRTLNEWARSMRIHSILPKMFWVDVVNTVTYFINCGQSVPLDGRLPEEVWSRKEVNLSYLRVFDCVLYVHINSKARSKLDPKSRKCTFIGYSTDEFGYQFWYDRNRKIIRSKDVVFNENVMYKDRMGTDSSNIESQVQKTMYIELKEPSELKILGMRTHWQTQFYSKS